MLIGIIAIIVMIAGSILLWVTGLLTAFLFVVITILILYAFHKMDVLDVEENRWLLLMPFGAGAIGLVLDKTGVLQIQPLSVTNLLATPFTLSLEVIMLLLIIILLIVDIAVGRR